MPSFLAVGRHDTLTQASSIRLGGRRRRSATGVARACPVGLPARQHLVTCRDQDQLNLVWLPSICRLKHADANSLASSPRREPSLRLPAAPIGSSVSSFSAGAWICSRCD